MTTRRIGMLTLVAIGVFLAVFREAPWPILVAGAVFASASGLNVMLTAWASRQQPRFSAWLMRRLGVEGEG